MPARIYTGNKDGAAAGRRAGMTEFIKQVERLSGKGLWNNGDWGVRDMRGKVGSLSVHATGRAVDLSYRKMTNKGKANGRAIALQWVRIFVRNADLLGIEMILDYFPSPHGRAWKCNRAGWLKYERHMLTGAPLGDWLHVELSPQMADSAALVKAAFIEVERQMTIVA